MSNAMCLDCQTVLRAETTAAGPVSCECKNKATLHPDGKLECERDMRALPMNDSGILCAPAKCRVRVSDLSKDFVCLLDSPLRIYNGNNQQIAVINPRSHEVKFQSQSEIKAWTKTDWPIPIASVTLDPSKWILEIKDVKKTDKIIASEFFALRLIACGYTCVYTPDETSASIVEDKDGKKLGVKILTQFVN